MPKGLHPNSLANLQPFAKGTSGNPEGRPNAGASIIEWLNALCLEYRPGMGKTTLAKLKRIANAPDTSRVSYNKRVAARQLLECLRPGRYGVDSFHKLLNRLVGYPTQALTVDGSMGVTQKRIVIVENFAGHSIEGKPGFKNGHEIIDADQPSPP